MCNNIYTIVWEQRKLMEVAEYRNGKAHEREFIEKIEGCSDLLQSVIFCGQFNTCPSVPLPTPAFALV